ncbi:MAG: hypothetical protein ACREH8_07035 [Opitutaceae bacterium]
MLRRLCRIAACAALVFGAPVGAASEALMAAYMRVEVAPAKTSIYLGSVSMTMPTFVRVNGGYEAAYVAKVFPFFFYNETGRLRVEIPDASLRQLERGETIEFTGRAVREDGAGRRVEGKITPADAGWGKIKVRVFYSKRIELIFNTTYRFVESSRDDQMIKHDARKP